jgi:hypothetical protein
MEIGVKFSPAVSHRPLVAAVVGVFLGADWGAAAAAIADGSGAGLPRWAELALVTVIAAAGGIAGYRLARDRRGTTWDGRQSGR